MLETGTVIKVVTNTTIEYDGGTRAESVRTVDLTAVAVADIDEAALEIPDGFQKVNLSLPGRGRGRGGTPLNC